MVRENKRTLIMTIIIVLLVMVFIGKEISFSKEINIVLGNTNPVGELLPNDQYGQTFINNTHALKGIRILMATYGRKNTGRIEMSLKEIGKEKVIKKKIINMEDMLDNSYIDFDFAPIFFAKGKNYELVIKALEAAEGNSVTIWINNTNTYNDGELRVNGETINSDIVFSLKEISFKKMGMIIILIIMLLIILWIGISLYREGVLAKMGEIIHHYRYIIGILIVIILALLKVHGSSIGMWDQYIPDSYSGENQDKIIGLVKERAIRSDEWLVQTPWFLGQGDSSINYATHNGNIGIEGQNMILLAPTKHVINIGKLPYWGFLLGRDFGFSWWWNLRGVLLLLATVELALILTNRNKLLSWVCGMWILFAPPIQWWYSTNLVDIIMYGILAMVCTHYYIQSAIAENKKRYLYGLGILFGVLGLGSSVYPPFQIPMVIMVIGFFIGEVLNNKKMIWSVIKKDLWFIITLSIFLILIYGKFILDIRDVFNLIENTVYPGKRVSIGGELPYITLDWYLVNILYPYKEVAFSNNCASSQFISFWPIVIAGYLMVFKKIKNMVIHIWFITMILFIGWAIMPISNLYGKVLLLQNAPAIRVTTIMGLIASFIFITIVGNNEESNSPTNPKLNNIILSILFIYVSNALYNNYLTQYIGNTFNIIVIIIVFIYIAYLMFYGKTKYMSITIILISLIGGVFVNPIVFGLDSVYHKQLAYDIQEIKQKEPDATWITIDSNIRGDYLIALGVKTINSVNYVPQLSLWKKVDPKGIFEEVYNRYAHIAFNIKEQGETQFNLIATDIFQVDITPDDLKKLEVDYIVTNRNIENVLKDSVELVYNHSFKIYRIKH